MALHTTPRSPPILLSRNERIMPSWVNTQSDRVGPKPPLPPSISLPESIVQPVLPPKSKIPPEPDYEVIEFSQQQYSNAPVRPSSSGSSGNKTPDVKSKCTLCGCNNSWVTCDECPQQIFCVSCDDMFHKHPKRKNHIRKTLEQSKPPLPPKMSMGHGGQLPPVAPPRRNKRGILTPLMQRKDQVQNNSFGLRPAYTAPSSPAPSLNNEADWQVTNLGNFKSGNFNIMNRPLPATPKTSPSQISEDQSSRSDTPKSLFDNIQRPPSVTLEKIKNKANATLDRMQLLQQRYRQQKERVRNPFSEQNHSLFEHWSNISSSPSQFRSGSISSGMNSSHLDLMDDSHFNLFNPHQMPQQHTSRNDQLNARGLSTSVFNLPQTPPPRKSSLHSNGWISRPPQLQQAQSMAQLNCVKCHHVQPQPGSWNSNPAMIPMAAFDPWSNQLHAQQSLNHSNLSLNVPPGYVMPHPSHQMYPPPVFMNQRGVMYPAQAYMGSMGSIMNPGIVSVPPVPSRAGSRIASPALSRKSLTLRRKQNPTYFNNEPTDDEDSDEDDRRSIISNRSGFSRYRQRRLSSASQCQYNHETETLHNRNHRQRVRERNVPPRQQHQQQQQQQKQQQQQQVNDNYHQFNKITSSSKNGEGRPLDSDFNSSVKSFRIYSDLDSEGSTTKALIQAKIKQKLKEEDERKRKNKSNSKNDGKKTTKQTTGVQTCPIKSKSLTKKSDEDEEEETVIQKETISQEPKMNEAYKDNNQNKIENTEEETALLLGPPPATPNYEWECEFCTFVNEANVKICSVCCKTPSKEPKKCGKNMASPKKVTSDQNVNTTVTPKQIDNNAFSSNEKIITNNIKVTNIDIKEKQESLEDIWATLDENIQSTAHEVNHKSQNLLSSIDDSPRNIERQMENMKQPPVRSISTSSVSTLHGKNLDDACLTLSGPIMNPTNINSLQFNDNVQAVQMSPHNSKISNAIYADDDHTFEDAVLANIHNNTHLSCTYHAPRLQKTLKQYCSSIDLYTDYSLQPSSVTTDVDIFRQCENIRRQPSLNDLRLTSKVSSLNSYRTNNKATLIEMKKPLQKVTDLYKYTAEELNAAVKYSGPNMHPLQWLQENWPKLITTVQSLATKYGQERIENTIGTISQIEARDALRLHNGNIWQAVTECIEQRQRKYREISNTGNFSREDIVTALTIHQGNVNLALTDLERSQLKPFLMRIWGSPGGVENESGSITRDMQHSSLNISKDIHDFLSVHAPECMPIQSNKNDASNHSNQANLTTSLLHHLPDNTDQYSGVSKEFIPSCLQIDETLLNNKYVLKDLETLIGNIEQQQQQHQQKQQQQQQQLKPSKEVPMKIDNEYDPEVLRILTKSPIVMVKNRATPSKVTNNNSNNPTIQIDDVKNFMWQHIQEIVPNLVGQVEKELLSESENITMKQSVPFPSEAISTSTSLNAEPPPPVDHDEFLMEELIKPNLKNATIKEELPPVYKYAAEIETFRIVFDKALAKDYEREYDFDSLYGAKTRIFHLYEGHLKENTEQPSLHTKTLKNIPKEERKMKQNPSEESLIFTIAEEESSSSLNSNKKTILNTISKAKSHSSIPINNTGHKTLLFKRSSQSLTPEPLKFNKLEQNKMEHLTLNEAPNFDENIHNSDETTVEMEVQLSSVTCDSTNLNVRDKKFSKIPIRRTVKLNNSLNNFNDIQNVQASTTTTITQAKKVVNGPIKVPRKPETIATEDDTTETETIDTLNSNEMMLMIHHVPSSNSLDESSLLPATSTSTLHSLSSTSSDIKRISNETSSKQNLTDLVKDTQRIIQQMRDEINFNDIITSEESELYTDDYDTDEYEDDGDNDNDVGNEKDGNDNDDFEDEEQEDKEDWVVGMEYNDGSDNKKAITERINQNLIQQQGENDSEIASFSNVNSSEVYTIQEELFHKRSNSMLSIQCETSTNLYSLTNTFHEEMNTEFSQFVNSTNSKLSLKDVDENNQIQPAIIALSSLSLINQSHIINTHEALDAKPMHLSNLTVINLENSSDDFHNINSTQFSENSKEENHGTISSLLELHTIGHLSANKNNQKNLSHFKSQELTENHENHNLEPHEASISLSNSRKLSSPSNDHIHIQSENEEKNPNQNSKKMLEDTSTLTLESSNPELVIKSIILTESVTHLSNALKPNSENEKAQNNQVISPDASKMPNEMNTIENVSEKPENSIEQSSINLHETGSESIAQLNNEIIANNNSMHNNGNFESEDNVPSTSKLAQANLTNLQIQNFSFIDQNSAESNVSNKDVTNKQQQEQSFKPLEPTKIVETNQNLKIAKTKSAQSSKIPKPKEMKIKDQKSASKKNINIRSKSFSVPPPTSIGINSVKTLRQELLKQTQKLNKSTTPSKQPPPPFVRKKSITDAITKLTKPNSSNLDEKTINSKLFLSKIRNHGKPRLPKKKYHETCFSDDDYESSTTSERECEHSELMEVTQRKLSVPVFRTYPNVQPEIDDIKTEDLIEKFLKEDMVASLAEAQIAVTLISMKFKQDVSIWAAKQCNDLDHAIALLQQECELCNGIYPLNEIVTMLKCTHKCCKDCAKKYFTVQITERSINDCNCPFCKLPELHQQNEYEDENLEYFSNLDIFLKNIINVEVHELFQLKLRDRTLLKDPNFKWCIQCSSGFFARPKQKRLICPDCGSVTCAQCRKTWQKQHENITCEQFTEWLQSNDPDAQHLGVQQHLEKNGIDCPKCKFRFSLSRGGCMHFTCTQCKYEFCYGCARPFMMGANCNISSYCAKLGLHAHHPRNCLFYLRDKLPIQLQILLRNNGVSYEEDNMDALGADITKSSNSNNSNRKISIRCPIPIQKETPSGLVDTICNNDVPDKHAGLCRNHYVEYLTSKVVKANIDPLPIFDLTDCVQELRRRGIALPERGPWDTDEIYKNMCAEVIKQNIPLDAV